MARIRSVNHRGLQLKIRQPGSLEAEEKLRTLLRDRLVRGSVELSIDMEKGEADGGESFRRWIAECSEAGLPTPTWSDFFERQRMGLCGPDNSGDIEEAAVLKVALAALALLCERRLQEGRHLVESISEYLGVIRTELDALRKEIPEEHGQKIEQLGQRIAELSRTLEVSARQDISRECALLIERLDVSEEWERLDGHWTSLRRALGDSAVEGRHLDFLCQEMHREINTLSNKAQSLRLSGRSVIIKTHIDKIREQVQNLV